MLVLDGFSYCFKIHAFMNVDLYSVFISFYEPVVVVVFDVVIDAFPSFDGAAVAEMISQWRLELGQ